MAREAQLDLVEISPQAEPPVVQIMDFGLAKLRSGGSKITRLTKEGSTVGTAGYMSPEQIQGHDVDHRSDIFSFGVLLYEINLKKLKKRWLFLQKKKGGGFL